LEQAVKEGFMKRKVIIAVAFILAVTFRAQAQKPNDSPSNIAAAEAGLNVEAFRRLSKPVERVNGTLLTERDLRREMYAIFPYAKQHNGFPKAMEAEIRKGALSMITFEELVYQEAQRRKMTIAPERLARAESDFRRQFGSPAQFQQFLHDELGGSRDELRTKIKRSLLIEDLLRTEVTNKSTVTLADVKAFYLKNPERFRVLEMYGLQTITIMPPRPVDPRQAPAPPTAEQLKQMKTRAEDALRQAQQTKTYEEFGMLAEKISEDDYRVMMGAHHPMPPSQLPAEVLQAASRLQPGQISGLIQAEGSYTILRLNSHTQAHKQTFTEVYKGVQAELQRNKSDHLRHELNARLSKNAKIEQL
jgi:parvulin-like peptidyl-prolyl isomerase